MGSHGPAWIQSYRCAPCGIVVYSPRSFAAITGAWLRLSSWGRPRLAFGALRPDHGWLGDSQQHYEPVDAGRGQVCRSSPDLNGTSGLTSRRFRLPPGILREG